MMEDKPTPSSLGDIEAAVPTSIPDTTAPLSVRSDTDSISHTHTAIHHVHSNPLHSVSAMQTIQPSDLAVENTREIYPGSIRLGASEFAVTLPMDSRVKDDYDRVWSNYNHDAEIFLKSLDSSIQGPGPRREHLLSRMHEAISRLNNVSTHPDLNITQHLSYEDSELTREADWAEYSSSKFRFLGLWIQMASIYDLHLILAVRGFAYTRPREDLGGNLEVSMVKGSLSFGIHSNEGIQELFKAPSAIIVLDSSFNPNSPSVQHTRTTYTRNGSLLPVIWLLVSNACEHIERCLPDIPELERVALLIQNIDHLRDKVGDLQDDALGVYEDVEEILGYLLDSLSSWPLPIIEPLQLPPVHEFDSSTPSSDEPVPGTQKRSLQEAENEDKSSKRARVDMEEISEMTQSTKPPSQTLDHDLHSLEKSLIQLKATHAVELETLQSELAQTKLRLQGVETAMSDLQHRYESRTSDLHKTRQERDRLTGNVTTLEQRTGKQKEDLSKLRDERLSLKRELEEARQELKAGGGDLATLEAAREENRRLTQERDSLQRKADYEKNQAEYTREQYQTASTVAAQAGNELRQVREENEALARKVAGNAVRLREINMKDDSARHLARITELELMLASRDDLLRKKEEELREIRKNRPSTRSTSTQPRSPKWAGSRPTSPGVNHNGNGNGLAGRGSALRFSSEMPF
ncbi:hypothetical protein N7462_003685 [Penicillium macrosclerotiorum]|uniref:uncharacterized protein n=1 Tax=Penicillium macrosclerotiorum TaxID=303699 RepID=UPI00254931D7|nr:uncharacterized protein N7462_003685 [Penicillium macrosclerotiorum]KAJ5689293.1 hypothetical protein N7462_003685 [Penicillium macrosclerotiorum]